MTAGVGVSTASLIARRIVLVGLAVALAASAAACGGGSSEASTAVVQGRTYYVGVGGEVDLEGHELVPFAPIDRSNDPSAFAEGPVLAVDGIDPAKFLVARTRPERARDPQWGSYLILWGDRNPSLPEVCPLFPDHPPDWCDDAG